MSLCSICSLCGLYRSQETNLGQQQPLPSRLTKELEDSRTFSLNSLLTLIGILALSGPKVLQPMVLALLIYTVTPRLVVNTCFLENYPTLSRFLHVVPLFGTSCIAGVELVFDVQSPALALVLLLLSVLPLITTIVHHGRQYIQPAMVVLPIRLHDPLATTSNSVDNLTYQSYQIM